MTSTTPEPGPGPSVSIDIHHAGIRRPDERGLMPIEEARAWLAGRDAYAKGEGTLIDGTYVLESDRTWAALLSLADGEELLAQARRLTWEFEAVRGMENLSVRQRYGDDITLRWVAEHVGRGDAAQRPCTPPRWWSAGRAPPRPGGEDRLMPIQR